METSLQTTTPAHQTTTPAQLLEQSKGKDQFQWYAVRLFLVKPHHVYTYFEENGLEYFVPVEYVDYEDRTHHIRHKFRPIIRNLVFVKKSMPTASMRNIFTQAPFKMSVIRKNLNDSSYYEIPAQQMREFQAMCSPEIAMREFLSEEQAKLKPGSPVYVKYGPLKGLSGRLVRSNKKYFLLKEIPGMAVMLKVARWCCRPTNV